MTDTSTSNMVDIFIRELDGADRVVVETKNALGEMDAHYLHAPEICNGVVALQLRLTELEVLLSERTNRAFWRFWNNKALELSEKLTTARNDALEEALIVCAKHDAFVGSALIAEDIRALKTEPTKGSDE
jgi:hypothetical protein